MFSCLGSGRGGALLRGEDGLYPEFRVTRPVAPLAKLGKPRPWIFVGTKGIPVTCYSWDVPNPKAVVVLVHGYGAHCMFEWLRTETTVSATPKSPQDISESAKTKTALLKQSEREDYEEVKASWNCCGPALVSLNKKTDKSSLPGWEGISRQMMSRMESTQFALNNQPSSLGLSKLFRSKDEFMTSESTKESSFLGLSKLFSSQSSVMANSLSRNPSTLGLDRLFMSRSGSMPNELSKELSTLEIAKLFMSRSGSMPVELRKDPSTLGLSKLFLSRSGSMPADFEHAPSYLGLSKLFASRNGLTSGEISRQSSGLSTASPEMANKGVAASLVGCFNTNFLSNNSTAEPEYSGSWVQRFVSSGHRVVGIDLQGHGASHGWDEASSQVELLNDLAEDVKTLLESLANEAPIPIFLVGAGMGGCVSTRAAELLSKAGVLGKPRPAEHKQTVPQQEDFSSNEKIIETELSEPKVADEGNNGVLHRVVWQKPVPLAGLILLSPWLGELKTDGLGCNSCFIDSFWGALQGLLPHCGGAPRPPHSPRANAICWKDPNTFKGKSTLHMLREVKAGMQAALAEAHWLKRQICRDPRDPLRLSDWAKLLHRRIAEEEAHKRKELALQGKSLQSLKESQEQESKESPGTCKDASPPASQIGLVGCEEKQNYWRLSVLIVQSLDDAVLEPMGAIRLFEKLGGRAKAPQPWASELKEDRRKERCAAKQQTQGREQHQQQNKHATLAGEETNKLQRESSDSSVALETSILKHPANQKDWYGSKDFGTASQYVEGLGEKEGAEINIRLLSDVGFSPQTLDSDLIADAKHQVFHDRNGNLMGTEDQRSDMEKELFSERDEAEEQGEDASENSSVISEGAAENPKNEKDEKLESEEQREEKAQTGESNAAGDLLCVCNLSKATDAMNPETTVTNAKENHNEKAEAKKKRKGNNKKNKGAADNKPQGCFYNCSQPQSSVLVSHKISEPYTKKKHWGKVPGCLTDPYGCVVRVEEAQRLMEEVKISGFDPLPPELSPRLLNANETTDEETEDEAEFQKCNEELQFERITSVAAEGALQLWLLKTGGHELTKNAGNEELQFDIISSFIDPTVDKIEKAVMNETF